MMAAEFEEADDAEDWYFDEAIKEYEALVAGKDKCAPLAFIGGGAPAKGCRVGIAGGKGAVDDTVDATSVHRREIEARSHTGVSVVDLVHGGG